ncbi:hypothetical protein EJ05DRAFT_481332 [Pseudovirgaria hyperparasitica]|uniref:Uncharacterized protein n=1 Tax=Pseudovirgaria hyperparasitica TaxID=470096 RepID=A0A6A6VRI4_9PEZI|nr:uncharacterized protein EJ05DRAFT_481332 [Pseudovirgaria hyperparasitica]KAF2752374.1 hypothetical protein EJ05DRAFT_481332 [Pseudovirgaria hyperparasitica]
MWRNSSKVRDEWLNLLIRSDIHTVFDQKRFAIIPKSSAFLVHIVALGSSMQLANLYHNVALQQLVGVAVQYLFARFAWTVFAQLSNFLQQGLKRTLCTYAEDGEIRVAEFSGDQCKQIFGGKSRSQSPRKRQRDVPIIPAVSEYDTWKHPSCRRTSSCDGTPGRKRVRCSSSSSRHSSIYSEFWGHSDHSGSDQDFGEDSFNTEQEDPETVDKPQVDSSSTSTRLSTDNLLQSNMRLRSFGHILQKTSRVKRQSCNRRSLCIGNLRASIHWHLNFTAQVWTATPSLLTSLSPFLAPSLGITSCTSTSKHGRNSFLDTFLPSTCPVDVGLFLRSSCAVICHCRLRWPLDDSIIVLGGMDTVIF